MGLGLMPNHGTGLISVCPDAKTVLAFLEQTFVSVFAAQAGAEGGVALGFQTPFILERANPTKVGDAKPWAFGGITPITHSPMVARLPKGWNGECTVHPRSSYQGDPLRRNPRTG
jgi:hypothetical protein